MGLIKKLIIIFIIFSMLGGVLIVKHNNLSLHNLGDMGFLIKEYIKWTGHIIQNASHLTANAIKLDWLPKS